MCSPRMKKPLSISNSSILILPARIKHVLATPELPLPPIDPPAWVQDRKYMEQNYEKTLASFLEERTNSVNWLQSLSNPKWTNAHNHPKFGSMSAEMFLANWLAHDYLHFRQIAVTKYKFLKEKSGQPLDYAGNL